MRGWIAAYGVKLAAFVDIISSSPLKKVSALRGGIIIWTFEAGVSKCFNTFRSLCEAAELKILMKKSFLCAYSLLRVLLKHLPDQILSLLALHRQIFATLLIPTIGDVIKQSQFVTIFERDFATKHVIEQDTGRPHVYGPIVSIFSDHFWRYVLKRATTIIELFTLLNNSA